MIEVWTTFSAADFRPVLPTITVPALLVYGAESNFYPPPTGPWVSDAIPSAELLVYEGADHSPHVAEPDRFAADLARFALRERGLLLPLRSGARGLAASPPADAARCACRASTMRCDG